MRFAILINLFCLKYMSLLIMFIVLYNSFVFYINPAELSIIIKQPEYLSSIITIITGSCNSSKLSS